MMMLGGIIMAANADNDAPVSQAPIVGHIISDSTVTLTIPVGLSTTMHVRLRVRLVLEPEM